ncbi:MAG: D-alanine--D-alanine ligase [Lachnospiraceae bacterium]|nr:D-alanine--D-alanine ligase [Lachnospiraceae bacterium]
MKIVVLAGGTSTERDVSLVTGKMVYQALKERGHNVILLDVFLGYPGEDYDQVFEKNVSWDDRIAAISKEDPDIESIKKKRGGKGFFGPHVLQICQMADIVFMGLHGANGEDGKVQATLDLFEIKYTGSNPLGAAVSMDKGISKQLFREQGIPTPGGIILEKGSRPDMDKMPAFPVVVKVTNGGSSVGVYMANDEKELTESIEKAHKYEDTVIVEQFIKGREFSVGVIDGEPLPVIEIVPKVGFYDYQNKYQAGSTDEYCPADLPAEKSEQMQTLAKKAYDALHIDSYTRVDMMMDESGQIYVLEANTLPGMTPTSLLPQEAAVIGYDFGALCDKLIEVSLRKWE